jgi:FAD/FMN-containing dehydrogenase
MITAVTKIVGDDRVCNKQEILEKYSGDFSPLFVVWPMSTAEVVEIVTWANKNSYVLIPVSSGSPRRRGSSLPKVDNAVIIDLSKMNKILRIDPKNKVVMLEPGVTFGQLIPELKKNGLRPLMPLLPKATKSVLTSCLDREPTTIPRFHWDLSDPLLCTETVFGSGDTLRTGSAAGPGSLEEQWASGQAQKNPQGPSQFDPFRIIQGSQGTIGVTTWITMKCELLPEHHHILLAGANNLNELEEFNYALLRRRLVDEHFMINSTALMAAFGKTLELPEWVLVLGVSGHGILAKDELEYRTSDTMDIANEKNIELTRSLGGLSSEDVQSLLNRPSDQSYWKYAYRGICREVIFTTTLDQVEGFYSIINELADRFGFPRNQIGAYIQPMVQGVSTHCNFDLYGDPNNAEEAKSLNALLREGRRILLNEGAFFSRPYGSITDTVFEHTSPEMLRALRSVKAIFDPKSVLNPGTLCFKEVLK